MSLPRETVMELMALADNELEGEARARAEALVASNAEARRFVEMTRGPHVRAFLEEDIDRRVTLAGADAIVRSVMASLAGPEVQVSAPRAEVFRAALPRPAAVRRPVQRSAEARARLGVASVGIAVAMAAGVALYVTRRPAAGDEPSVAKVDLALASAHDGVEPAGGYGVEVDEIDSPTHDISVFEIHGNAAAAAANPAHPSSVVIWVEDGTGSK